jgi:hypothetical protein
LLGVPVAAALNVTIRELYPDETGGNEELLVSVGKVAPRRFAGRVPGRGPGGKVAMASGPVGAGGAAAVAGAAASNDANGAADANGASGATPAPEVVPDHPAEPSAAGPADDTNLPANSKR